MATIHILPKELLLAILNNIDSVAHLAQCRLVNGRWNNAATQALFGEKITIKSEEQAIKLYRHLFRDIRKVPLLKHLHFELSDNNLPLIIEELLHLSFTPSIQHFTGFVKADKFFTTLFNIANESHSSFDQLDDMTKYTGVNQVIMDQRRIKFGSIIRDFSIRVVHSDPNTTVIWRDYLHLFRNLASFTLKRIPLGLEGI